ERLTDSPAHPYTQLLLSAAPDPDRPAPPHLAGRGAPPSLLAPPSGCRFHPRCPYAMDICKRQAPPSVTVADGHVSACWLHVVAAGCEQGSNNTAAVSGGKPLIAEPTTGVTFSEDFNPYDPNSVSSSMGTRSIVNEPLVEFDQLDPTPAGTHPWLATAFAFQNGGKDLQVTIRQNVKFNDGSAFGPADVAATFKAMQNPAADTPGVPPQASDPTVSGNTVTL